MREGAWSSAWQHVEAVHVCASGGRRMGQLDRASEQGGVPRLSTTSTHLGRPLPYRLFQVLGPKPQYADHRSCSYGCAPASVQCPALDVTSAGERAPLPRGDASPYRPRSPAATLDHLSIGWSGRCDAPGNQHLLSRWKVLGAQALVGNTRFNVGRLNGVHDATSSCGRLSFRGP